MRRKSTSAARFASMISPASLVFPSVCVLFLTCARAQSLLVNGDNVNRLTAFDVPFYWTNVANTPELHWDYPDVNVAKALGGCGIHNAMLYGSYNSHRSHSYPFPAADA